MTIDGECPEKYIESIKKSGLSIYSPIEIADTNLWIPSQALEILLNNGLMGISLTGLALRTRSKVLKEHVCRALGYPVPTGFKKTQPRFLGQQFDIYSQKSNNLQIWNEEISLTRRYVIIRIDSDDVIKKVKVVTGDALALLDTTGTLTQKYQARLITGDITEELITNKDTDIIQPFVQSYVELSLVSSPVDSHQSEQLMPIAEIFKILRPLIGKSFTDVGVDQERNRGAILHQLVCKKLGYKIYRDDGKYPDIRHQLLEVKLQTSPTIDLGLVCPDSEENLVIPNLQSHNIRHCDVRYVIFYAMTDGKIVTLTHLFITTGEAFFSRFPKFQGKVLNKKLQIPLPSDFFW